MSYTTTVVQILIASPTDVAAERDAVADVISNWTNPALQVAAPPAHEEQGEDLSDEGMRTLRILAELGDEVELEDVAERLQAPPRRAKYVLDDLETREYVAVSQAVGRPDLYVLNKKGRALLGRRNLL